MLRWKLVDTLLGRRRVGGPVRRTPPVRENSGATLSQGASLTWIGHASFVLRLGGVLVATDPLWSPRLAGAVPRLAPPGVTLERLPPIEVVTISHDHFDHLDLPTLRRIGPGARYVVPLGCGRLLASAGLPDVVELDWWESTRVGALEVSLVPARHWSMRTPWGRNESLWGGFVLRGPEGTAYHAGDTAYFDGFEEIGARAGPIDWALLPIGAYEPRWFMEPQHMCPEEAGRAYLALGARHLVAMHWGTFALTDEPLDEPPARLRRWWGEQGLLAGQLWILDIGETRALGGEGAGGAAPAGERALP